MSDSLVTRAQVHALASAAGAAPSIHNSQPWCFRMDEQAQVFRMYSDPRRALPAADPDGRSLHLSMGAALFNLRVAAAHLGRRVAVRLLPAATDPLLLAEVDLSEPGATGALELVADLYPAIRERRSSRQPFANRDVPEAVLGALMAAARAEDAALAPLEEDGVRQVMELTRDAARRTAADLARQQEDHTWLRQEEYALDGIPQGALGPLDHEARVPMRSFAAGRPDSEPGCARFEALPQLATLATRTDRPLDWLRAGQAMERVWLLATSLGVRASVFHQAMEWPDTRRSLTECVDDRGCVQTVLRLGYGPLGPPTPRRTVNDVLALTGEGVR
jgi:nitroreductase